MYALGGDDQVSLYGGTIPVLPEMALSEINPDDFTLDGAALVAGVNTNLGLQPATV